MQPQPAPSTQEVLAGLIERVTYHNVENGFCVLRIKARGHRDIVTVVGHSATIAAGEWIAASGEWVNGRTHGQQFKAQFLRTSPPTSAEGIEKYLASGMIRGVGPVHAEDLDCVVEPGVTRKQLNEHLRDQGLFFPIDPGANVSIGGMVATRASGTNAVRYGTMKDNVLALKVVLPNGHVMTTGRRARKSSAGYDLTCLFVGSEGTLGVIIEITLKLHGIPEAISAGVCSFPTVASACDAAIATIQSGIPVARIELLDEVQIRACNVYSKLNLLEMPTLFLEFHGSPASVAEQAERFGEIAREYGGGPFEWATKSEDRTKLWQARHDALPASKALRPGAELVATDVCVPISCLAQCVAETKRDIEETGLLAPIAGHVGDGNFHVFPLVKMQDAEEVTRTRGFLDRLAKRAIAMDGTCTGEHGIGQGKMSYLIAEHGPIAVDAMRVIKHALDPRGIMNPGKIIASG